MIRSTQSVGERKRRGSADEGQAHPMYQQTIHGTSGVSRRPALFDLFKSRSRGDARKQPSIMQKVKAAVQNITKSNTGGKDSPKTSEPGKANTSKPEAGSSSEAQVKVKDGSAHPHPSSDTTYYHTVMLPASRRASAIAKVMDIFRVRASVPGPAESSERSWKAADQYSGKGLGRVASLEAEFRRSSLGHIPTFYHRASDAFLDPRHAAILFRDSRGLPVADPFLENFSDLEEDNSQVFVKFFKFHKCYDLIPTSAKLVVFDTQMLVKKSFFALVYNGVRAAPLWDSQRQQFVGMLTITDFIKILQMYYTSPDVTMEELEEHRLETWRQVLKDSVMPLVSIGPDSSLYDAIKILITNRIHRLPVIDPVTGNVLYILTHKRILRFLFLYIYEFPTPSYLDDKLRDLRIGTLNDIETATEDTSIIDALRKFVNRRVSALPLIDSEGRLKDIYAKFDVINLAAEKTYNNLDVSLKRANEHRNDWFEGVQKCTLDERLFEVMERIVRAEVHRLVIVDEEDKVIGIISLSDLLMYLVLRPTGECGGASLRNEHASIDERDEATGADSPETSADTHGDRDLTPTGRFSKPGARRTTAFTEAPTPVSAPAEKAVTQPKAFGRRGLFGGRTRPSSTTAAPAQDDSANNGGPASEAAPAPIRPRLRPGLRRPSTTTSTAAPADNDADSVSEESAETTPAPVKPNRARPGLRPASLRPGARLNLRANPRLRPGAASVATEAPADGAAETSAPDAPATDAEAEGSSPTPAPEHPRGGVRLRNRLQVAPSPKPRVTPTPPPRRPNPLIKRKLATTEATTEAPKKSSTEITEESTSDEKSETETEPQPVETTPAPPLRGLDALFAKRRAAGGIGARPARPARGANHK